MSDHARRLDDAARRFSRGRLGEGLMICRQVLAEAPTDRQGCRLFAVMALRARRADLAADALRRTLVDQPDDGETWWTLARIHSGMGLQGPAGTNRLRAVLCLPEHPETWEDLLRQPEARLAWGRAALCRHPDRAILHGTIGNLAFTQDMPDLAEYRYRIAMVLDPASPKTYLNRAAATIRTGRDDPFAYLDRAARFDTASLVTQMSHRAQILSQRGAETPALGMLRRLRVVHPADFAVLGDHGLQCLLTGDWRRGWADFVDRHGLSKPANFGLPWGPPAWDGRTPGPVAVWAEDGVGDEILYGTVFAHQRTPERFTFICDPRLFPLIRRGVPDLNLLPRNSPVPAGTVGQIRQKRLMSLTWPNGPADVPSARPWLAADPERRDAFARRWRPRDGGLLVGIAWKSVGSSHGPAKSCQLADLAPLLRLPGVRFINLQYGDVAGDLAALTDATGLRIDRAPDLDTRDDLDGLAALIAATDLVLTVSNVTAHLGGALGHPTWVLAQRAVPGLWYWGAGSATPPFYPAVRVFRQERPGDWSAPVAAAADALSAAIRTG